MERSERFYYRLNAVGVVVFTGALLGGGAELGISTYQQVQSEYPWPVPYAQYQLDKQTVEKTNRIIIQLADGGRYVEIATVAKDPVRLTAKERVSIFEQLKLKREVRIAELRQERFSFHPRTVLAVLLTATGVAMSITSILRSPRST